MFNEKPIISKWVADMYDQNITETHDVEFLLSIIGKRSKRILEVCCGSGRILVPLVKAGHIVQGMDFDEHMLAKIKIKDCQEAYLNGYSDIRSELKTIATIIISTLFIYFFIIYLFIL